MMRNPREEYGRALLALARRDERVWALDADLNRSTMSCYIEQEIPDRFVEAGIAEANMVGMAAGLALCGKIPFCHSFAVFLAGRAFDQIRQAVCIPRLNVKLCGSSAGLSDFGDGSTHQAIEDMAIMRALPNMAVLSPADGRQAAGAVAAMARWEGPAYIRIHRSDMEDVGGDGSFEIGRVYPLRPGRDVTIFATGVMVHRALQAAAALADGGIDAAVVNVPTVKPLNGEALLTLAARTRRVLTCEDHSVLGGFGSAVAEALAPTGIPVSLLGVNDCFGQSARSEAELVAHYGLTAEDIAARVRALITP